MKLSPPLIVAASLGALLCIGFIYLAVRLGGASHDAKEAMDRSAGLEAQVASLQSTVNGLSQSAKLNEATIGAHGSLQVLAKSLQSGDMELSLKSLKIVSGGKELVSIGLSSDQAGVAQGGLIAVTSADGSSKAEISAGPGKSKVAFRAAIGADAAQVVHSSNFGDEGFYLQKGPSDDLATRTDGAGLRIVDAGASFFMVQNGAGTISIDTSSVDDPAKITVGTDVDLKKFVTISVGAKDAVPGLTVSGAASGDTLNLGPERLSLFNKDGVVTLAAAEDDNGGFVFVNDRAGTRRAIMTAGSEGHGSLSVYGNDKRSNTLFPVYNLQESGSTQK